MKQKYRTRAKVLDLRHNLKLSYREIALITGLSKSRVYQIVNYPKSKTNNGRNHTRFYPSVNDITTDISSVLAFCKEKKSIRTIAQILGIPKTRVANIIRKYKTVEKST